ncbi:glycosyltransferase family 2 protein [Dyella sp.]|jgi:glycosyltransferase involved in cell wall biosynthesis|uniref:glycosyltransferase family 2 protein n=1 Tax=Dyella sp. TaxID=1869338 RepID=UPI002D76E68D|nr:glycosyltransferase family 2 protein [Dyella sp.]HET6431607.1 glycosyltransferase family 2 protein [Dyella sp.]
MQSTASSLPSADSRRTADFSPRQAIAPISVVVPCFRCTATIAGSVARVAAQTMRPAEVLLVDDASGDGTLECLQQVARDYPEGWVKVFALPANGGPSAARNEGWKHASQPWIAFLDADDSWHPRKIELQMAVLNADPHIAMIAHLMNVQPRSAPPPPLTYPIKIVKMPKRLLRLRSGFPTPSVILRRDLPFRFDESRRRSEDALLFGQILLSGYRCVTIRQVLVSGHKQPFGEGGLSGDLAAMQKAGWDSRQALYAQGLVGRAELLATHAYSIARYARRHVLTFLRRQRASNRAGQGH